MYRLKNKYEGRSALVIMGGPSILENKINLGLINKDKYTVFLESKALTPRLLNFGLEPDFYLMLYPEKCKDNSVQNFIFRSFLAEFNIEPFLRPEYLSTLEDMRNNFDTYFEFWRPQKGAHKRYRWRPSVYLKDSPYDLLRNLANTKIIVNRPLLSHFFPDFKYGNELYFYEENNEPETFDMEKYYNPIIQDGRVTILYNTFINSAAIVLYPLLYFMGFCKVYFIGMDMSMLGSMEYSSFYTFKSMRHFGKFFEKALPVFCANFRKNRKRFMRQPNEFNDMEKLVNYNKIEFTNIYEPFEFAAQLPGMRNLSFNEFLNE